MDNFIIPRWHVPANVHALMTTRKGGTSEGVYGQIDGAGGLNLGTHVGDDRCHVLENRTILKAAAGLPKEPLWLNQTHSTIVHLQTANECDCTTFPPEADAVVVTASGQVAAIMTADCLPVLFCSEDGKVIGAAHAGWRGLLNGVLEATLKVMLEQGAKNIQAWLGAAIGATQFEVGEEVFAEFIQKTPSTVGDVRPYFRPHPHNANKYLADIYGLARARLLAQGLNDISGGEFCTVSEAELFYSYRRDHVTGRMATLIWMDAI